MFSYYACIPYSEIHHFLELFVSGATVIMKQKRKILKQKPVAYLGTRGLGVPGQISKLSPPRAPYPILSSSPFRSLSLALLPFPSLPSLHTPSRPSITSPFYHFQPFRSPSLPPLPLMGSGGSRGVQSMLTMAQDAP